MKQQSNEKKQFFVALCVISVVFITNYVIKINNKEKEKTTFVVGTAAGYAPFVSINEKGGYEGFDIEVASAVAKQLEKKLIIKDLGSMTSLFLALENGSIDTIIWGLSITQERLQKINMVRYYGEDTTSYSLLFWNQIPENVKKIEDMCGKTVCVEPNSSQESVLDNYPCIFKKPTEKVDDALLQIQYGKVDAALVEPAIAKKFKRNLQEIKILEVPLSAKNQVHGIGIAILKENQKLTEEVKSAIEILRMKGVINDFAAQWGIE